MVLLRLHFGIGISLIIGFANADTTDAVGCHPKSCNRDQNTAKPVCGSDGLTYPSRCLLERARCVAGDSLSMTKRGPCRHQPPCTAWQMDPAARFRPKCKPDGGYAAAQCHADAGFCWCVTGQGLPVSNTAVQRRNGRLNCNNGRKTHRRDASLSSPHPHRGRAQHQRPCRRMDKARFNNNLINIFHSEHQRETGLGPLGHTNESDLLVNRWKFRSLDVDHDDILDKHEYRELKRMVKKAVKPKKCAKNFPGVCDVNGDGRIEMQEWAECLTRDGMDDGGPNSSSSSSSSSSASTSPSEELDEQDEYPDSVLPPIRPSPHVLMGAGQPVGAAPDDDSPEMRDEDPTDCLSDRATALLDGGQFYVPDCTADGRYKKVQCYKAANYCFCVHEDTGKNIPGTSVKNGTPECDQVSSSSRPMKGCPDERKAVFLRDLVRFLQSRMSNNSGAQTQWSGEEGVATWTFMALDKNKNKLLDRNEWKAFKEMVGQVASLKKCGKKLPRYCDSNRDRRISKTEWLACLNVQPNVQQDTTTNQMRAISARAGKQNPLHVLMED